jgi:hypothetical protein
MNDKEFGENRCHLPASRPQLKMSMEFYKCLVWICSTINLVALLVTIRRIVEAYLIKKAEIDLETKRLELKAHLINEREERFELRAAQRLIDSARGGDFQ